MASDEPTVHDQIAEGLKRHPAKKGIGFNIGVTVLEVGGSIALFHLAQRTGASDVVSYLVGSIGPVVGGFVVWARARKFSGASAAIFAFTALSALVALVGSTIPKVLLYKDCAATALIGLMFLGSYNYDQILPLAATTLGIVGSIAIARYFTKKGQVRDAAEKAARAGPG